MTRRTKGILSSYAGSVAAFLAALGQPSYAQIEGAPPAPPVPLPGQPPEPEHQQPPARTVAPAGGMGNAMKAAMAKHLAERNKAQSSQGNDSKPSMAADQLPPDPAKSAGMSDLSKKAAPQAPEPEVPCDPLMAITTSYTIMGDSYLDTKKEFDGRMGRIHQFAASQSMKKFQVESLSFTINHQRAGMPYRSYPHQPASAEATKKYRLQGKAEFHVDSSENAFKLGQYLTQEKFEVTVSNKPVPDPSCPPPKPKIKLPSATLPEKTAPAIPVPTGTPPSLEQ